MDQYIGKTLYCRTTYHRGPYMYSVHRVTKACLFVKEMNVSVVNAHGDSTYDSVTITDVTDPVDDSEYKLIKRIDPVDNTLYFIGSANHGSPQRFYIWNGEPMKRDTYY